MTTYNREQRTVTVNIDGRNVELPMHLTETLTGSVMNGRVEVASRHGGAMNSLLLIVRIQPILALSLTAEELQPSTTSVLKTL